MYASWASTLNNNPPRRRRLLVALLATAIAAVSALPVVAGETVGGQTAQELLRASDLAARQLNYHGVFVYQRGVQIDSMRLVHHFDGEREQERMLSLSGPAREVIRDGDLVTCLFADDQAAMVEKSTPRELISLGFSAPIETLLESYRFVLEGADRIAGRAATVVSVLPASDDRYAYRLWIDDESRLLLKSVVLGGGGRVLEQVQFTQIDILDDVPPSMLAPEITGSGFTWRTDNETIDGTDDAAHTAWQARWVPQGFRLKENNVQHMATSQMPVDHMVYSDGLAMVSVFVEKLMPDEAPLKGYSARGAINAFSRVDDDYQITVVGELPLPTVRQIATSVSRAQ